MTGSAMMTPTTVAQTSCHVRRQVRQQLKNIGDKNGRISQLIRATRPASSSGLVEEPTRTAAPKRRVRGKQTVPVSWIIGRYCLLATYPSLWSCSCWCSFIWIFCCLCCSAITCGFGSTSFNGPQLAAG